MNIELIKDVIKKLEPNVRIYENIINGENSKIVTLTLLEDYDDSPSQESVYAHVKDVIKTPEPVNTPIGEILTGVLEPPHIGMISKAVNESPNTNYVPKDPIKLQPTDALRKMGLFNKVIPIASPITSIDDYSKGTELYTRSKSEIQDNTQVQLTPDKKININGIDAVEVDVSGGYSNNMSKRLVPSMISTIENENHIQE